MKMALGLNYLNLLSAPALNNTNKLSFKVGFTFIATTSPTSNSIFDRLKLK